ncbi:hypothetical protein M8494_05395 [Serratia ureilytica]
MLQQPHRLAACGPAFGRAALQAHAVAEAVSRFKQGKLDKAVLSRILDIGWRSRWRATRSSNLMVQNPTGYHFPCRWPMAAC